MKTLISFILVLAIQATAFGALPPKKPLPNTDEWLQDQQDQTDTLAIPLDNSETDDQLEMEKLEKLNTLESKKRH